MEKYVHLVQLQFLIMNESIFVNIASYKDSDLIPTLDDLYTRAAQPERVFVGVFLQDTPQATIDVLSILKGHPYRNNMFLQTIDANKAKGCGWARNVISKHLYGGQDYFMCVDSHSRFLNNWDTTYIDIYKNAPENAVISVFPQSFDFNQSYEQYTKRNIATIYTPHELPWTSAFNKPHCQRHPKMAYERVNQISGGNIFGDKRLAEAITLDDYTFKHNQEQEIYSLLIYLHGLDLYAIPQNIVWHKYITTDTYRELFQPRDIEYRMNFLHDLEYKQKERTIKDWVALIQADCDDCKKTKQLNS